MTWRLSGIGLPACVRLSGIGLPACEGEQSSPAERLG
jgi:hypothetical protein